MIGIHHTIRVALVFSSLLVGSQLFADDGEREVAVEINKANGLLRSGDVDGAMKLYGQVQTGAPDRAEVSYNMAVAKYRKGDVTAAEQLFKQTSTAENDALAAKARYNLGNCNYASAIKQAEVDRSAAIKDLGKAIDNYRSALEIDPNDADSRANIELASAMIEKLRDQEKKEQQQNQEQQSQQKNDKQNEKKQDNSKSSDKQQQNESQQGKSKDQQKDQQQSQQQDQQQKPENSHENKAKSDQSAQDKLQKSGEESKNQSSDKNESLPKEQQPQDSKAGQQDSKSQPQDSKSQSQEQNKPSSGEQKQPPKPQNDQSQQQSQSATQKKSTNKGVEQDVAQPSEQQKDQKGSAAPKGSLTAADQKNGKANPQGKDLVDAPEIVADGAMTTQEAEKMLQAIRDQEMIRRLKRQAAERNQHIPVDRDW